MNPLVYPVIAFVCWGLWATVVKHATVESGPLVTAIAVNSVGLTMYVGYVAVTGEATAPKSVSEISVLVLAGVLSGTAAIALWAFTGS